MSRDASGSDESADNFAAEYGQQLISADDAAFEVQHVHDECIQ